MGSMGKGQMWVNGHHAGRYWSYRAYSGSCRRCSYAGTYREDQCMSNCGDLSQRWYVYVETSVACNMGSAATCQACFLTESTHDISSHLHCRYHVPRSWLKPSGNLLVVLEEYGGDLAGVALATRTT